jgi:ArsR family transcriptional regulator, arsenate/arsenite/antimonite-responsive transcriptional repressor
MFRLYTACDIFVNTHMATKTMADLERLFQALADATRLRILGLLLTGEVCVCDIHETLKIPQPKASRHLAYLRRSGLVDTRREGLWIHYRLAELPDPVVGAITAAVRHALTHVDVVQHDAARLRKKTGCCLPAPRAMVGLPCCAAVNHGRAAN